MLDYAQLKKDLRAGGSAAAYARTVRIEERTRHTSASGSGRKPDDPARQTRIEEALEGLRVAMIPLRSVIGSLVLSPIPDALDDELRGTSREMQRQRQALKKMLR